MVIKKPLILTLSYLLLISSQSIHAQSADNDTWRVQPNTCIVQSLGDFCELELSINLPELPQGEYCYYQNEQSLFCFELSNPILLVELRFSEYTLLTLRNKSQQILFTQALDIKTRKTKKKVRRVRDPWSLF
ncbi:MAG: hypothetical protein ACJAVV_000765 [Alphaproteobacteria bacterium]|jgi:hypothetical protein